MNFKEEMKEINKRLEEASKKLDKSDPNLFEFIQANVDLMSCIIKQISSVHDVINGTLDMDEAKKSFGQL
jgi:hypothetical protein